MSGFQHGFELFILRKQLIKMKLVSKYIPGIAATLLLCAMSVLASCTKSEVQAATSAKVTFSIDWSGTKSKDGISTASIFLYPLAGTEPIILRGVSAEKTTQDIPAGTYRVISYNENLVQIRMRNSGSYSTFEAFIVPQARQSTADTQFPTGTETVIPSLEYLHLLTGTANRELAITGGEPYNFTLRPKTATSSYRFTISVPTRLSFNLVTATLSGVASRMGLFEAKPLSGDISSIDIPLTLSLNETKDTLIGQGVVETFGVDPVNRNAWSNTLFIDLTPTTPKPEIKTHYESDLTKFFDTYNNLDLDIDVEVKSPDPIYPDEVIIVITVKPWIIDDGGHVDIEPEA